MTITIEIDVYRDTSGYRATAHVTDRRFGSNPTYAASAVARVKEVAAGDAVRRLAFRHPELFPTVN